MLIQQSSLATCILGLTLPDRRGRGFLVHRHTLKLPILSALPHLNEQQICIIKAVLKGRGFRPKFLVTKLATAVDRHPNGCLIN
ncbi:MAG: hypothetical protein ACM65L_13765 [Microcoleus sp.]